MPAWLSLSRTGQAWGILPRLFAVRMRPRVPLTGILSASAQRRPAKSSITASVPGCVYAHARTADSPFTEIPCLDDPGDRRIVDSHYPRGILESLNSDFCG